MPMLQTGLLALLLSAGLARAAPSEGWRCVFEDSFDRCFAQPHWRMVEVSGRGLRIREDALHFSHNSGFLCTVPLPRPDVRVAFDLTFAPQREGHSLWAGLRSGEDIWGGGGIHEPFAVTFDATAPGPDPRPGRGGRIRLPTNRTVRVELIVAGGTGRALVNGREFLRRPVPPPLSEVNRTLALHGSRLNDRNTVIDNVRIFAGPAADATLPVAPNTPAQNRAATIALDGRLDPADAAPAIQQAIEALPPNGGAVLLPEGTFVLRRHLHLPSHVSLRGRGAGRTVLKAAPVIRAGIASIRQNGADCTVTLAADGPAGFAPGDAVSFGPQWGHPGRLDPANIGCVVTAADGNHLTVRGIAPTNEPPKTLLRFAPLVFAWKAEFVEVADLALIADTADQAGAWGGFRTCPLTFGRVAAARVVRVRIDGWRGDGLSFQTGADGMLLDNTVTATAQGFHPGTTTHRLLCSRNRSTGNGTTGLYFCWHNRNGIYSRNTVDAFDGFAWPRDRFNIVALNDSAREFRLEQGAHGVVFANRFPGIVVGHGKPGAPTHDFILARNRVDSISFRDGRVEAILYAGNSTTNGLPTPFAAASTNSLVSTAAETIAGLPPIGAGRSGPAEPPVLREPVVDARRAYRPGSPDAGFQAALDRLADTGGTILLPAGRYPLQQPLRIPPRTTLAGRGTASVLYAAPGYRGTLLQSANAEAVVVRDLSIRGACTGNTANEPAIRLTNVASAGCEAVDLRGWDGPGLLVTGGTVIVRDCRALDCGGPGFVFDRTGATVQTCISRGCGTGFILRNTLPGTTLIDCIAGVCRDAGFNAADCRDTSWRTCNANDNGRDGFRLERVENADLTACIAMNNNQRGAGHAGIRLGRGSRRCRILFCQANDSQPQPTQVPAILDESVGGNHLIRCNIATTRSQRHRKTGPGGLIRSDHSGTISDNIVY